MIAHLIIITLLCGFYLKVWPGWEAIRHCPRPFIVVPILVIFLIEIPVYGFNRFMVFLTNVPISIDCPPSSSTIVMPLNGNTYELLLFPLYEKDGTPGLLQVFGVGGKEIQLTSPHQELYRCQVTNHGSVPISNVEMALHVYFRPVIHDSMNPGKETLGPISLVREWPITMPMIGVGQDGMFVFYILNSGSQFVSVTLPQFVTFIPVNRETRDSSRLIQPPGFTLPIWPQ